MSKRGHPAAPAQTPPTEPPVAPVASPVFDLAFEKTCALCATFAANEERYLSANYQEAEVRKDFIDKFFIALGWDVNHDLQTNPYEQEVKVESPVAASGARRADYAFRLRPNYEDVRFFVEAKKPFGDIASAQNYFQANRYGWNKGTPLAVLTDFEQFHVIDCRYRPDIDQALHRAVLKFHYRELTNREKFAQLYWLFSREAVSDGSLEKRARELPKPRGKAVQRGLFAGGYQTLDEAFLEQLDTYRAALAKAFKKHHAELDGEALTEITQRVLDRIVFMRFLEDKGIEGQRFVETFGDKGSAWEDFLAASRRLDAIYNGIIFKPHPVFDKKDFAVDEEAFADLCEDISRLNSPYDFNSIPIHILGSIYERFLGRVIVATDKRVRVDDKPEVRKAGGVFYTPKYIVTYIVDNTVGKLIEGKSPAQIAGMRFADIACGSGSFLLGIFDVLLRYHAKWYNDHPGRAQKAGCIQHEDGSWHLSLGQRRQILVNNIYGVDIDHQACEVAQLSLYLKLLEDETTASARGYQLEFKETLLPNLAKNIVCGNSLIGRDILTEQLFASDEERKLNPMDFADAFPHVFRPKPGLLAREPAAGDYFELEPQFIPATETTYTHTPSAPNRPPPTPPPSPGFDAIVGNPPYVRMEEFVAIKNYLRNHYEAHEERADFYTYFIERSVNLIRASGLVGMIVSNKFAVAKYGRPLRETLAKNAEIVEVADFAGARVFKNATVRTFVLTVGRKNGVPAEPTGYIPVPSPPQFKLIEQGLLTVSAYAKESRQVLATGQLGGTPWQLIPELQSGLIKRLASDFPALRDAFEWGPLFGIKTGLNDAFVVDEQTRNQLLAGDKKCAEVLRPILFGKDVKPYWIQNEKRFVIYLHPNKDPSEYPVIRKHLESFKPQLVLRAASQKWFELQQPSIGLLPLLAKPKIIYPIIAPEPRFALDEQGFLINDKLFVLPTDSLFLLGILNSSLAKFFFASVCARLEGSGDCYYEYRAQFVERFPICEAKTAGQSRHDHMVYLVQQIMAAKRQAVEATTEKDRTYYESKGAALDGQIDRLVYELYGLTDDEIDLVESQTAR